MYKNLDIETISKAFVMLKQNEVEVADPVSLVFSNEMLRQYRERGDTDSTPITVKNFQKERTEEGDSNHGRLGIVNFDFIQFPEINFIPFKSR